MELSQTVDWVGKSFTGYMVNTDFSSRNSETLGKLIDEIQETFDGSVFCMPRPSLHITLLDWIAPLVDYDGQYKDKLFSQIKPDYDKAMTEVLAATDPITVRFDELRVSPTTILIVGHDNGQIQHIRDKFLEKVDLLPGTKPPPQIIHSSLARFIEPTDLSLAQSFVATKTLDITQQITDFRLVRTVKEPMLEYETLKRYEL